MTGRSLSACLVVCLTVASATAQQVDFARDIQPILNANCTQCHGGVKAAGGLSFIYSDQVIGFEADSGEQVVVPNDVANSEMFRRITSSDDDIMPPAEAHSPLTRKQTDVIKRWIEQGANWSNHWAFVPPVETKPPVSDFDHLATNDIDRFLFKRLQQEGLTPGGVEEPGRLLRRLSHGLTGLPPTIAELNAFETAFTANSAAAIEDAVDDLIARPAFGERWASMWLDLVRYADSGGLGIDQRRTIWPYRDWVVASLNNDLPFDQFTIKQLAGDLLPQPTIDDFIATACHRNTQTNNEGGTDDEEFRVEAVVDRINTTWQTWGGVTFGCVQCHDHPYDPFRNTEYYQFMDLFNNSADSDLNNDAPRLTVPNNAKQFAEAERLHQKVFDLKQRIHDAGMALQQDTDWMAAKSLSVRAQNETVYGIDQKSTHAEFFAEGTVSTNTQTQIQIPSESFVDEPLTAIRLTVLPLDPETAIHSPEWGFVVSDLQAWVVDEAGAKKPVKFRWAVPDVAWLPENPLRNIDSNGKNWGANTRIHRARELVLLPQSPLVVSRGQRIDLFVKCSSVSGGSHPLVIKRGHIATTSDVRWSNFAADKSDVRQWHVECQQALADLKKLGGTSIPVMLERPEHLARPTHVFGRGNRNSKEQQVWSGLPKSLTAVAPVPGKGKMDRLKMARWWVSDQHPLTARVFTNRLWQQLFGVGIVPTLEDFGSSGDKPTHPELLDHLALRFQRKHNWSVKAIVREIVLSYAYRQSSVVSAELQQRDPDNRLVGRGPRLRLSAESVRDQSLAVSGLLSKTVGGPPVYPPLPEGVWKPFDGGDKWKTAKPEDANRYRRSLYTYMKRSIPFPTFAAFDAPSREFCSPRRLTSNTPLQALFLLNDQAFVECAEALAGRLENEFQGTTHQRLASGYQLVTGRMADPERLQQLVQLHKKVSAANEVAAKTDDVAKQASSAWVVVAQVLLNLDEALTY